MTKEQETELLPPTPSSAIIAAFERVRAATAQLEATLKSRPFSTYPEDRQRLLDLAVQVERECDEDPAIALADLVKAILTDEHIALTDDPTPAAVEGEAVANIVPDGCSGTAFAFEPGVLHVYKDGSGYIAVDEADFQFEDDRCEGPDGPEGSVHWIARLPAGEVQSLRNFLNGTEFHAHPAPAPDDWPEPKIVNPDIADPTGIPYLDCLIHRLLDAQQDISLQANERMSQPLCDASALMDEIETAIRKCALTSTQPDRGDDSQDGNRPIAWDRDQLGRLVRDAWIRWAQTQPNPKPSWLVPYDDLPETDKEADRQIGETVARWTIVGDAAQRSVHRLPDRGDEALLRGAMEALRPFSNLADEIEGLASRMAPPQDDPNNWSKSCQWEDLIESREALTALRARLGEAE